MKKIKKNKNKNNNRNYFKITCGETFLFLVDISTLPILKEKHFFSATLFAVT